MSSAQPAAALAASAASSLVFEVSWEVCSQIGGIYTVLRSRAPAAVNLWGERYWLIGPYRESSARIEFEAQPESRALAPTLAALRAHGLVVHCGRWLVTGRPQVLLIDVDSMAPRLDEIRHYLWVDCGIAAPAHERETCEVVAFGHAVADVLMDIARRLDDRQIVAHFHEWQGAAAVPFLKHRGVSFATVFTTHATVVGRRLSAANYELYERIDKVDAAAVAREHGVESQFQLERCAAQGVDVFTTVSEITALESAKFLGREADVVVPNGLNIERFAAPHEFQVLHRESKERIHQFVTGHFFPSYTFDLDQTLYVFTAGRYEYRNKGMDVFIDALDLLNRRLKREPGGVTVVAFIITRAPYRALNVETLDRKAMFDDVHATCAAIREDMRGRLVTAVTHGRMPTLDDLLDDYAALRLKRMFHAWHRERLPTIVTHDLVDDYGDSILCRLRHHQLINRATDPVKVVFHPDFVTSTSTILGMDYDHFVRGCNLGVFASYYEPWGYTPLDCVVRGVPAITSDLSGFGAYVQRNFPKHADHGIFVAPRLGAEHRHTVETVCDRMVELTRMSRRQRIGQRNEVEAYAERFDWQQLIRHYIEAWQLALERRFPRA